MRGGWSSIPVGVFLGLVLTGTVGCAGAGDSAPEAGSATVFAASSLSGAFTEIGHRFEARTGASISFSFAGSSSVVAQLAQGAPGDVVATADEATMQRLVTAGLTVHAPEVFAHNALKIVVAPGNPKHIASLADLARSDVTTVLCAAAVPCGNYSRQALAAAGVTVQPASDEANVIAVVGRVASGEADAGIAYVTDVLHDPRISSVAIVADFNVAAAYPIAVVRDSTHRATAEAFVDFVRSPDGQAVLRSYGFAVP
jgi:molybdate transport system substrate-binding protein